MSTNIHSAKNPMLGYRFQPLYALLVLWNEAEDDTDRVQVEADDDVTLNGSMINLYQLKHSTDNSKTLTIKNDGFWKTIRIWASFADSAKHRLYFVTADQVKPDDPLYKLVQKDSERNDLVRLMEDEANSIIEARNKAKAMGKKPLPYETRIDGCLAFNKLSPDQRINLVNKILIRPRTFDIFQVQAEVIRILSNMAVSKSRPLIAERLLQWWDKRMLESKDGITKSELVFNVHYLIAQFQDNNLPDDFSIVTPASIDSELGGFMEKQIDLVNGGFSRKKRAAIARWRARNQRERWIQDDLLYAMELEGYDEVLRQVWDDRHAPMKDDLLGESENVCKEKGRCLLDWVHNESHLHINPIRTEWKQHFLIHGSYHQLADELKVGWHPEFKDKLSQDK
ncbi:ABC-three component system protein [Paenibacillus sp. YN15]|uniref:ABC-three component system protein n=1 Tax=Paenibacillus sp. YN15 TaxID=1742774 RepID=UPI000DCC6CD8|nr:ABC-three component system protein [Paenibacillus sp. YN15]RAU91042.1 hypothetical protein DQG13_29980 [Paenibacillus sp. YN15]